MFLTSRKLLASVAIVPVVGFAVQAAHQHDGSVAGRIIGHFRLVGTASAVDPAASIDQASAIASALANLSNLDPTVSGYHVKSITFQLGLTQVTDLDTGEVIYTGTKPHNAWVIFFQAPPQNGYQAVGADSIVDGLSGKVISAEAFSQVAPGAPDVPVSPIPDFTDVDGLAGQGGSAASENVGIAPHPLDPTIPNVVVPPCPTRLWAVCNLQATLPPAPISVPTALQVGPIRPQ